MYKASSEYEVELWNLVHALDVSLADFSSFIDSTIGEQLGSDLDDFLDLIDRTKGSTRTFAKTVGAEKQGAVILLSQMEDFQRQVDEGRSFLTEGESNSSYWEVIKTQPLDEESTVKRDAIFLNVNKVQKCIEKTTL